MGSDAGASASPQSEVLEVGDPRVATEFLGVAFVGSEL